MTKVVMIVDDAESVASSLAIALENIPGVTTVVMHDPRIALRLFTAPDVHIAAVVTDLNLPHLNGFELITKIRSIAGYGKLPAILITADERAGMQDGSGPGHPDAIFWKPFSVREVCRVVEELLQ